MKKPNRRQFARMLAFGAAVPFVPQAPGQQSQPSVPAEAVDVRMKSIADVPMNADRTTQVRQSMEQTIQQIDKIRAYKLNRPVEPALNLGLMFETGAKGGRRAD